MMLEQFNVYRNCSAQTNNTLPYYMIVQNDYYADLATRAIIPLMRARQLPRWHQHVAPRINIEFDSFLLCTPMISNLNNKRIQPQDFVCNLSCARQGVIDSIDTLITNC
ncbi:CcdB family protein [Klebsiella aerogenes]|uniref:CcdB family protein n=1 Tax=Klebsiella aerogenes TaxID=548 RepID=UPI0005EDA1D5|nr:CcdB family protein [Klebsiella aerogenes]MCL6718448.1 CcdB family protein [Klebsiella sp. T2.Ur]EMF0926558.1 CcdB family protein [Klebsiella aerogenes]KJP46049.1 plasmid maintenance protein CcdB [Klebsiella aerogenes]MDK7096403.1 CcdB family protein [Klebsiella aerogenes]MDK7641171.1 CcdB family protein [Klebsiella aerogenes]